MTTEEVILGRSRVSSQRQVHIPSEALPFLNLRYRDCLEFVLVEDENKKKNVVVRRQVLNVKI